MKKRGRRVLLGILLALVIAAEGAFLVCTLQGRDPSFLVKKIIGRDSTKGSVDFFVAAKNKVSTLMSFAKPNEMQIVSNLAKVGVIVTDLPVSTNGGMARSVEGTDHVTVKDALKALNDVRLIGTMKVGTDWKGVVTIGQKAQQLEVGTEVTIPCGQKRLTAVCEAVSEGAIEIKLPTVGVKARLIMPKQGAH